MRRRRPEVGIRSTQPLAWIERHFRNLPDAARPAPQDLPDFFRLFATYLTNSFDLLLDPGQRLYSPEAHCFCPT